MSLHSYSKCWLHFVWGTYNRQKLLHSTASLKLSEYFQFYANEKHVYIKQLYVNSDHVHILLDMPTNITIEDLAHLFKGSSSNWINKSDLLRTKFAWARGYGVFSVSQSSVDKVGIYIANQEEHHRRKTFTEEYEEFIRLYRASGNR